MECKTKNNIYLILLDRSTNKQFKKYFDTEDKKDRFKRKLKYSKKIKVLSDSIITNFFE